MDFDERDLAFAATKSFRCCLYGDFSVVIEGHKGLKLLGDTQIEFSLGKEKKIAIVGANLVVAQMTKSFAFVMGKISGVEYESCKN